ncbi:hypothetical protein O4J56_05995 [Nocardiopsis sp. RSe5-2]|uniref:Uncharacterized protein n=1 Tax=Nocardiopsis endophytica TaxID=3018445 RepID=A0ABT4U100_9ACTN|nr:hypothetical protein [Nocardiopsis endophytica]MDA2810184.1 hypothetical protein [Nocardiopsis endophytica]
MEHPLLMLDAGAVQARARPDGGGFLLMLDRAGTHLFVPASREAVPVVNALARSAVVQVGQTSTKTRAGAWWHHFSHHTSVVHAVLQPPRHGART